ncbi:MAG TPA: hypothetical protein VFA00_05325, partial [Actinomycetota bacterium]|nr:hypothetical protein [Actinomycetota bacterium]
MNIVATSHIALKWGFLYRAALGIPLAISYTRRKGGLSGEVTARISLGIASVGDPNCTGVTFAVRPLLK